MYPILTRESTYGILKTSAAAKQSAMKRPVALDSGKMTVRSPHPVAVAAEKLEGWQNETLVVRATCNHIKSVEHTTTKPH